MMGVSRADVMQMPLQEYEGRLWHWNEAHRTEGNDAQPFDPERTQRLIDKINSDPALRT